MIGFGKSDKYTSPDNYSQELHMMSVKALIQVLQLLSFLGTKMINFMLDRSWS